MEAKDIVAFVGRDWARVAASKEEYWVERKRRLGPIEGIRVGDLLRRQMFLLHPDWPTDRQREEDLRSHVRVSEMLRRARIDRGR